MSVALSTGGSAGVADDAQEAVPQEVIRRVASNQQQVAVIASCGLLLFWLALINMGLTDSASRSFVRDMGMLGDVEMVPWFAAGGGLMLILACLTWMLNGAGRLAFTISEAGIGVHGSGSSEQFGWHEISHLDREVGSIVLHLAEPRGGYFGRSKVVFDLNTIDWSSTELEALIVYYRPDLFSPASLFRFGQ